MNLHKKTLILFLFPLAGVLFALPFSPSISNAQADNTPTMVTTQPTAEPLKVKNGCIQPLSTFAYSVEPDELQATPGFSDVVSPTYPWLEELQLDTSLLQGKGLEWLRSKVMGTRVNNGNVEIWVGNLFIRPRGEDSNHNFFQTFTVYNPETKKSRNIQVDFKTSDEVSYYIEKLFFADDGSIWGLTSANTNFNQKSQHVSILSKFDEKTNSFKFVQSVEDIPIYNDLFSQKTFVLLDGGTFWFIVREDAIYKYVGGMKSPEKVISINDLSIDSVYLDPDRGIYLLTYDSHVIYPNTGLSLFAFASSTLSPVHLPTELAFTIGHASVLVDNNKRIWLDSDAWMDGEGKWYRVINPPIFLTNYAEDLVPRFRRAKVVTSTHDGRIWFVGDNGSAWLDVQKETWCWFTTYEVTPFEDADGRLWIVAGKELYFSK